MKGFVYTLEAVIASTLVLTMVLVVPQVTQEPDVNLEPVRSGLESADQAGKLDGSPEEISDVLDGFVPSSFNYSVMVAETERKDLEVTGNREIELESGYKKMLIWIEEADNLEITFKGDRVLETSGDGYREIELGNKAGYLNFTADNMELDSEINRYRSRGSFLDRETVYIINYININEDSREVRVMLSG